MALVDDIFKSQIRPKQGLERSFLSAENEVLNLAFALAFGFLTFLASVPRLVVVANTMDVPVPSVLLPSAFGSLALLPLFLYLIAAIQRAFGRLFKGTGTMQKSRRGLFWSLLVASPWVLLSGLLSEMVPTVVYLFISLSALCVFLVNWSIAIRLNETQSSASQTE